MKKISSIEEFDLLVESGKPFYLLKHSTTCPISKAGFDEFAKFEQSGNEDCFFLTVQDSRELSNYIADKFHIKHESPQAIIMNNADVVWHASHFKITNKALTAAHAEIMNE